LVIRAHDALDVSEYFLRDFDRSEPEFQNLIIRVVRGDFRKFFPEIPRLKPAAGHYGVNGALRHQVFVTVRLGVVRRHPFDDAGDLSFHVRVVQAVNGAEHSSNVRGVFGRHPPDIRRVPFRAGSLGILNVEDIFETRFFRVCPVYQGDALRAPFDPSARVLVPEIYTGAGNRSRTLDVNERLIHERIFVHLRRGIEK
jgi:hypothetical protein